MKKNIFYLIMLTGLFLIVGYGNTIDLNLGIL